MANNTLVTLTVHNPVTGYTYKVATTMDRVKATVMATVKSGRTVLSADTGDHR